MGLLIPGSWVRAPHWALNFPNSTSSYKDIFNPETSCRQIYCCIISFANPDYVLQGDSDKCMAIRGHLNSNLHLLTNECQNTSSVPIDEDIFCLNAYFSASTGPPPPPPRYHIQSLSIQVVTKSAFGSVPSNVSL